MSGDLVPVEAARLAELEAIVESGLDTFVTVGRALAEISNGRLYRATHGTFVAYAQERFGIGKSHAYRMISAAKVAEAVSPMGDVNERQARELVGLDDDEARGVLAVAQAGAKLQGREHPTADDIRQSRRAWERADDSADEMSPEQARDLTDFINITSSFDDDLGRDTAEHLAASDADYARQAADMERELREERDAAPKPATPRRRPLPDVFWEAAHDLGKHIEKVARLCDDDRFPQNAEQVAAVHRNDLLRHIDALQGVVDRLPSA